MSAAPDVSSGFTCPAGQATQRSVIGSERIVDRLSGEHLPQIC